MATNDLRTKQHQWAPTCTPLATFRPYLDQGHDLVLLEGVWSCTTCGRMGKWLSEDCSNEETNEGHEVTRYGHADACHRCGRFTLHTSRAAQATKIWATPCKPAARFLTYSDTHELELHERTWRCKWCQLSGAKLKEGCRGGRPTLKPVFVFSVPSKKKLRKNGSRRLWGRRKPTRTKRGRGDTVPNRAEPLHRDEERWGSIPAPIRTRRPAASSTEGPSAAGARRFFTASDPGRPPDRGGEH